jgi:polyhydroxybutyrate depolymerase
MQPFSPSRPVRLWLCLALLVLANTSALAGTLVKREWVLEGTTRTALISIPEEKKSKPTPLIFIFHGHGGTAENAARSFHLEQEWPEAICVYPQGLPTPGQISDPEGKRTGWQSAPGQQADRDLQFFDAMLASLQRERSVDASRVYCTGHSNGGSFTYLLWLTRGEVLAAVAPSSSAAIYAAKLPPKPALLIGGRSDRLVPITWLERTAETIRKNNECTGASSEWNQAGTLYPSPRGTPLITCFSERGHRFGSATEPALIAAFFQEHTLLP